MNRVLSWLAIAVAVFAAMPVAGPQKAYADDCASTNATAYQPTYAEVKAAFQRATTNTLGTNYPQLPNLLSGYPSYQYVAPSLPCILPQAIGWIESGWRQAGNGTKQGSRGTVLTGKGGCGYGLMQTSSGMRFPGQLPQPVQLAIASDFAYNIAYGSKILADTWNTTPAIGSNDPTVVEHWYYAVWAYNNWSWRNNPNNPDFPYPRAPYDGTRPVTNYPYQELVFGLAANPPVVGGERLWEPVALSLPDSGAIGISPDAIPAPAITHKSYCAASTPAYCCSVYLPIGSERVAPDYWR